MIIKEIIWKNTITPPRQIKETQAFSLKSKLTSKGLHGLSILFEQFKACESVNSFSIKICKPYLKPERYSNGSK